MAEKYDLEAMIKEIEQDESGGAAGSSQKLSQEEIRKLLARKMAEKKGISP